jgi:hypothetical protein
MSGRGWHLWFAATGAGSRAGILPGVDWRGRDAIVVAPPSLHACGLRYRWLRDHHHRPPPCPPRLLALLRRPAKPTGSTVNAVGRAAPYAAAALAAEVARVRTAQRPTGTRPGTRNDTLNRAAFNLGQLAAAHLLDERAVRTALTAAALDAGLSPRETLLTIASGLAAGRRHPRPVRNDTRTGSS